jgi:hypothetical protein
MWGFTQNQIENENHYQLMVAELTHFNLERQAKNESIFYLYSRRIRLI